MSPLSYGRFIMTHAPLASMCEVGLFALTNQSSERKGAPRSDGVGDGLTLAGGSGEGLAGRCGFATDADTDGAAVAGAVAVAVAGAVATRSGAGGLVALESVAVAGGAGTLDVAVAVGVATTAACEDPAAVAPPVRAR